MKINMCKIRKTYPNGSSSEVEINMNMMPLVDDLLVRLQEQHKNNSMILPSDRDIYQNELESKRD